MKKLGSTSTSSTNAQHRRATARKNPSRKALPPPTPSEAAFEAAFAALLAGQDRPATRLDDSRSSDAPERDAFVASAFAKSAQYLHDPYARIADAAAFHTKIKGVTFEGRADTIAGLHVGGELELRRDPANRHDPNAIAVYYGALQVGFIAAAMAAHLAPVMDAGARYRAHVASLTGGGEKNRGVNIFVERDAHATLVQRDRGRAEIRGAWDGDGDRVTRALIGTSQPHDAQRRVLERVDAGRNTLAIMGTGRGKSFCFQLPAALRAFGAGAKTLVVYPLRALANDQYEALSRTLDPLGLRVHRANGSIGNDERADLFEALREGSWDVTLATPEFLDFHRDAFRGKSRPALVVVDEAHHLYESRHRPAYTRLRGSLAALGDPQVLALTATAGDDAFAKIVAELDISAWVIDPTVRENLHVVDARNRRDKIEYVREVFAGGKKGIVYCNSRKEATEVATRLRKDLGNEAMFYHAGMPTAERHAVERFFREGELRVVVATSAFGEGIDLPDVRHVVLYHLNFDFAEFNQQAGRAGRDGAPADIHLLYGEADRRLNEFLIDLEAPTLGTLREIYRGMRSLCAGGSVRGGNADIAGTLALDKVRDQTVAAALRIFSDAALVEVARDDDGRCVRFLPRDAKIDMRDNERFAEGEAIRENFDTFCKLALSAQPETLERIVNRPIYPGRVPHLR